MALVACGGGSDADLLPETAASEIESSLDDVARLADEGDCVGAELAVADVVDEVEELREVDSRLKAALWEGTDRLSEAVERCEEEGEETEPTLEPDVEDEEVEKEKKPKKEKPGKEDEELPQEPGEDGEGPELSPQSEGKGEEKGGGPPPAEPEGEETSPSGGVGPGVGVE
ncbi:MAG TPA: hypothetical protein VFM51_11865 [Solirubrobacterales bacterium]|nr:hypothetical protein [Solirubrobacterales bacterium]